jgi:fumarate hydratase subunit beta
MKEKRGVSRGTRPEMTVYNLKTPVDEADVRKLKIRDVLYLSGLIVTARDQTHKRIIEYVNARKPLPVNFEGLAVYHCGPLAVMKGAEWRIIAAGPTTSARMEPMEAEFIERLKPRIIIGKGGMGERTTRAAEKFGAVYCNFTGGAAVLAAEKVKRVRAVEWLDLGLPEALWMLEVEDFGPLTVAIDSHGNNLHALVRMEVERRMGEILKALEGAG